MSYCFAARKTTGLLLQLRNQTIRINWSRILHIFLTLLMNNFVSVEIKLASKIPSSQQHYLVLVDKNMSPMPSFFFQPITYDCVKTEILSLPNNKSHGLYSSPTKLLIKNAQLTSQVLLFRKYLIFPSAQGDILQN